MAQFPVTHHKVIAQLPSQLEPNAVYFVRVGTGFDQYLTDNNGEVALKLNNTDSPLTSPAFTYNSGQLTGIAYSDGTTKTFSYAGGQLQLIDQMSPSGVTVRKNFNYTGATLNSITQETLMPTYTNGRLIPVRKGTWRLLGENNLHDGTYSSMSMALAGVMYFQPFTDYAALQHFVNIGVRVSIAGVGNSPVKLGIYTNITDPTVGDIPNTLLWQAEVDVNTPTSIVTATNPSFPLPLQNAANPAALYWVAFRTPDTIGSTSAAVSGLQVTGGTVAGGTLLSLGRDSSGNSYSSLVATGVTGPMPLAAPAASAQLHPGVTPAVFIQM